jgi:hypothetical protein
MFNWLKKLFTGAEHTAAGAVGHVPAAPYKVEPQQTHQAEARKEQPKPAAPVVKPQQSAPKKSAPLKAKPGPKKAGNGAKPKVKSHPPRAK